MTADEWRTSTRPGPMLEWLEANHLATPRKKRLFVFSACRLGWGGVCPELRRLLEAVEDCVVTPTADDPASRGEFHDALLSLVGVTRTRLESTMVHLISFAVNTDARPDALIAEVVDLGEVAPPAALAALVREQFGDPFRKVRWVGSLLRDRVGPRPADLLLVREWLTWERGVVLGLAQAIDEERAWDRMPILADALEDAGCDELALLDHLRRDGTHARGCWALDLLLGRE
jgi:hypothetical protein